MVLFLMERRVKGCRRWAPSGGRGVARGHAQSGGRALAQPVNVAPRELAQSRRAVELQPVPRVETAVILAFDVDGNL